MTHAVQQMYLAWMLLWFLPFFGMAVIGVAAARKKRNRFTSARRG